MRKELSLPIYFKGDVVKLRTGESCEVIDTWGVVRSWLKVKLPNEKIDIVMVSQVDSIVSRARDKNSKTVWGKVKK